MDHVLSFLHRCRAILLAVLLLLGATVPMTLAVLSDQTTARFIANTYLPDERILAEAHVPIQIQNVIIGGASSPEGFTFVLDDGRQIVTAVSDAKGQASIDLVFHMEDAGTHTYKLSVVNDKRPNLIYSTRVYDIRIEVQATDTGLVVTQYLDGVSTQSITALFEHDYLTIALPPTGDDSPSLLLLTLCALGSMGLWILLTRRDRT